MHSLKHDSVTGKKLSQVVLFYFVILFLLFTTTLLYWNYRSSTAFILEELQQSLHQRQVNAENSFENILDDLEVTVKYIANDSSLEDAVGKHDQGLTLEVLRRNLDSEINSRLDILFVKDLEDRIWADDSSPFFDLQNVLPLIAKSTVSHEIPCRLYSFSAEQSELVVIGTSFPLIHQKTGRVIGTLFGGIVLNNDISLVETIRKMIQAESLLLFHAGRIVASTQHPDTPLIQEVVSLLPVPSDELRRLDAGYVAHYKMLPILTNSSSLELVFVVQDTILANLKTSYLKKFFLLLSLIIGFSVLSLYLIRRIITASLGNLSLYATQIGEGKQAAYLKGPILEINQIGMVMTKTVQGLQETSVQLQEEMSRRQQVMDQLTIHRSNLEQIVESRTRELSTTNDELTVRYAELTREKTERLHAQEEHRQLAEAVKNSPVSIVITDSQGNIEYVNPKFSELTQYSSDEAIGQTPGILNAGIQSKKHFKTMWNTILAGKEWHGEFCNRKKNGELFWELASISPIPDETGKIKHFVAVKEDITARKRTEENLKKSRREAEEANKQKSLFLANMSHEIRTPMNAMIGLSELALETSLTDQQYDYLSKIHSSSKGLLTVLNDILDYSKIEAGKLELEKSLFSLPKIIDQVGILFVDQAKQKELQFRLVIEDSVPYFLYGDPNRLRQVLINLVGNSLKFTEEGTVEVNVSLLGQSEGWVQLKFSVVDSGIGIPADKISFLFHAFSQVDSSHTRQHGGTGLGLAISSELIEMMGGRLQVESVSGSGSTFSFILDFKTEGNDDLPLQEQQDTNKTSSLMVKQQVGGAHLLLVEDDAINQQIATEILAQVDIDVEIAGNGAEAVEKYRLSLEQEELFAAILMDIQMPILDGYGATEQIREIERKQPEPVPHIPIIAMTAHTMTGDREKGLASGMDDYISKPVSIKELFLTLSQWIHVAASEKRPMPYISTESDAEQEQREKRQLPDSLPGIDLHKGVARLEGNATLYLRLLKDFTDQYGDSSAEAPELLRLGDQERGKRLFHTVKGVAANLCAYRVEDVASRLEKALSEGDNLTELQDYFTLAWQEIRGSVASLVEGGWFETSTDAPVSSVDTETVSRLLTRLLAQLDKMDFQAVKSWQELKPSLQNDGWRTQVVAIERCILNFDFEKGSELVNKFLEEL